MLPTEPRHRHAFVCCVKGIICIAGLALLTLITRTPFLFPSLGGTVFILLTAPSSATAAPRNVLLAHFMGACAGWVCFHAFGLHEVSATLTQDGGFAHVAAAALALGIAAALMILTHAHHAPAGATTLTVALGLLPHLWQIPMIVASVVFLIVLAHFVHRLSGVEYPLRGARSVDSETSPANPRDAA